MINKEYFKYRDLKISTLISKTLNIIIYVVRILDSVYKEHKCFYNLLTDS